MPEHTSLRSLAVLVLCSLVGACCHSTGGSPVGGPQIETIDLATLPRGAEFAPIGSIGTAYRVTGGYPGEARLPTAAGAADALLPATIRLFRFDEGAGRWSEIAESRYDPASRELVAARLGSGIYTAFGWSANPAENAFQRLLLDSSLGYGGLFGAPKMNASTGSIPDVSVEAFRRDALLSWLDVSFTRSVSVCEILDHPDCPPACQARAGTSLPSCQVTATIVCPEPSCCRCRTIHLRDEVVIPGSFFERLPPPCPHGPRGFPCPICPNGLSCPGGGFTGLSEIAPVLEVPDYAFLDKLGQGAVTADPVLRETLQDIVEGVTGKQYPVPPPWP